MTKSTQFAQAIRTWMDVFMHRSMRGWGLFTRSAGLSMPQVSVLMQLYHKGACGMSEISERFGVTPAASSQLVDKLVQSGYIVREEDPNDRRAKLLNLTGSGREMIQQGIEDRYRWMEQLATNMTAEEKSKVVEALTILTEAAKTLEEDSELQKA